MTRYEEYLRRSSTRRLGFGAKPDDEIHPLKALAIVYGAFFGLPLLIAITSAVSRALFLPVFRWLGS